MASLAAMHTTCSPRQVHGATPTTRPAMQACMRMTQAAFTPAQACSTAAAYRRDACMATSTTDGAPSQSHGADRRQLLLASAASALMVVVQGAAPQQALCADGAPGIEIISDDAGFGQRPAQKGDLVLLHYVGKLKETGAVFDSTRGGLAYRDGGPGVLRPIIIRLSDDPVPGVCKGLRAGLEGMRIGGKRTVVVPPELGFRGTVLAPYAVVPAGSTLVYEVELIRLSARGPDELTKGIDRCGQGGAAQQAVNCADIEPAEFLV